MAKLRKTGTLAGVAALGAGVAAAYAGYQKLLHPDLPLYGYRSPFGEPETYRWLFGNIAYNHAGEGRPLLLVHGIHAGASTYEFRNIYNRLAEQFHVYTFDLLGYGLSERPNLMYTAELYAQLIDDFVREVIGREHGQHEPVAVIASSLSSSYVIKNAAENPERYARLVLTCPTGRGNVSRDSAAARTIYSIMSRPDTGQAIFNGLVTRASLAYFLRKQSYYDATIVDEAMLDSYYATTHMPGAKYAPSSFLSGYLNMEHDQAFAGLRQPVLLVWGKEATFTPVTVAEQYRALNPQARLAVIDQCSVLPHDEKPSEFITAVTDFLNEPLQSSANGDRHAREYQR